ncbi:hypothetical protein [Terrabacter sp. Soil811]|uniref:hypothetical protein n=1 Tax=Terrabacter sp. Soil811 TaxID=1736419 RepID=UPI000AEC7365|nr:hypothetical protein [Terrabacter sp. Soil811]
MTQYERLAWFPKPFGPGDMDGSGEKKVLGRPEMDFLNLLVRETAQNSWDARMSGVVPRFELRLRELDPCVLNVLRQHVFLERQADSPLDSLLAQDGLAALEIVDRGTKGLGGRTQNSSSRDQDEPNDYADFILTVGAPPEDLQGGGSYGFGKTASYLASRCSTIVVWSRSRNKNGEIIERLIASAMGGVFDKEGQRFTGRQWWGQHPRSPQPPGVLAFEPLVGDEARSLGQAVFERGFEVDETGTSILVLGFAPQGQLEYDGDFDPSEVADRLVDAVLRNLWPKLPVDQPSERRMDVGVTLDGVSLPLPGLTDSSVLQGLWRCLRAIRAVQAGASQPDSGIDVRPTRRYSDTTGHIALTNVSAESDVDAMSGLEDRVALMRHTAELVVRAEPYPGRVTESLRWVGVFKPVEAFDEAFSKAEPPAHDSWSNVEGLDKRAKSIVTVSMREVGKEVRAFLAPVDFAVESENKSTGALSSALAGLTGAVPGSGATTSPARTQGRRTSGTSPKIDLRSIDPLPRDANDLESGRQRSKLTVTVQGKTPTLLRLAALKVAVDGGTMESGDDVALDRWVGGHPEGDGVLVPPGDEVSAIVSYPAGVAISFSFKAGDR